MGNGGAIIKLKDQRTLIRLTPPRNSITKPLFVIWIFFSSFETKVPLLPLIVIKYTGSVVICTRQQRTGNLSDCDADKIVMNACPVHHRNVQPSHQHTSSLSMSRNTFSFSRAFHSSVVPPFPISQGHS